MIYYTKCLYIFFHLIKNKKLNKLIFITNINTNVLSFIYIYNVNIYIMLCISIIDDDEAQTRKSTESYFTIQLKM